MNPRYSEVAGRAGHRCEYCQAPEAVFNFQFEVEHIVPRVHGGGSELVNLALSCRSCNLFKSDYIAALDSTAAEPKALFHPRLHVWHDHFDVVESGEVAGLTDVGRATIHLLRMNSDKQVRARRLWLRLGLYP